MAIETREEGRKRKTHTKSRKGCGNCKLRRVKCDETKPNCQKCTSYGVSCNYDNPSSGTGVHDDLQLSLSAGGGGGQQITFSSKPAERSPVIPRDSLSPDAGTDVVEMLFGKELDLFGSVNGEKYALTREDVDILHRFRNRTVFTIGTARSVHVYRTEIVRMVTSTSYLTHIVLALTSMHDRYVANPVSSQTSEKESFHTYHGTAIFSALLKQQPILPEDRDPLWACAALLGAITIASTQATKAEESWPLAPPSPSDLDWLRMSDGKKEVWRLVNPLREDSVWKEALAYDHHTQPEPMQGPIPELEMLYPYLTQIYDYNPLAPAQEDKDDPYHTAASILSRLLEFDCNHTTIMFYLSFLGHMDPRFRQLLHQKDPKALLLLAWWYGKMCQYNAWWMSRRMRLEGQAICLYLEKYHADKEDIVRLLDYPKMMTGLVSCG